MSRQPLPSPHKLLRFGGSVMCWLAGLVKKKNLVWAQSLIQKSIHHLISAPQPWRLWQTPPEFGNLPMTASFMSKRGKSDTHDRTIFTLKKEAIHLISVFKKCCVLTAVIPVDVTASRPALAPQQQGDKVRVCIPGDPGILEQVCLHVYYWQLGQTSALSGLKLQRTTTSCKPYSKLSDHIFNNAMARDRLNHCLPANFLSDE